MGDERQQSRTEVSLPRPSREMVARAREFRKTPTSAERLLWQRLRNGRILGRRFRRQHPLGAFIADFFCDDALLVIEVDGAVHEEPTQAERDRNRDATLRALGLGVLHFTNREILIGAEAVVEAITRYVQAHSRSRRPADGNPRTSTPHPRARLPLSHSVGEGAGG